MAGADGIVLERCVVAGVRVRGGKDASVAVTVVMPLDARYGKVSKTLAALVEMGAVIDLSVAVVEVQPELA